MRVAARPQPEWRDYLRAGGRAFGVSVAVTSALAQFPWCALIWPNVQPTPTWRAIVRRIHVTNMGNVQGAAFWLNTNAAFATVAGVPMVQDNGFLGPVSASRCLGGTFSSAVFTVGTPFWQSRSVVNTDMEREANGGMEWLVGSRVPRGMDSNPLSLALIVATNVANNLSIVDFEWVELP